MSEQQSTVERTPKIFHPILFAIFPAMSFFANNISELSLDFLFYPVLISVGATCIYWALVKLITRDKYKAALLTSIFVLLFFSYGHLISAMQEVPYRHRIMMPLCLAMYIGCFYLVRKTARDFKPLMAPMTAVAIFLVVFPVVSNFGKFYLKIDYYFNKMERPVAENITVKQNVAETPDIYYCIFDRYAPAQTFKDYYQYDNSNFMNFLTKSGFVTSSKSRANYAYTPLSLTSSLNMRYLDFLSDLEGAKASDFTLVHELMANNEVMRFLKKRGYKYYHIGMYWEPFMVNPYADHNIVYTSNSESYELFLKNTMLYPIKSMLWSTSVRFGRRNHILYEYEQLAKMAKEPGPKFVFAHFGTTHPEYLFGANGQPVTAAETDGDKIKAYLDAVKFHNQKIEKVITAILNDSPKPPIVVLQSDEGPFWPSQGAFHSPEIGGFATKNVDALKAHCRIFNTYHLPGEPQAPPPVDITPVNTFRYIFSRYFKADIPPLPNECYVPGPPDTPFKFRRVTDIVKYPEEK